MIKFNGNSLLRVRAISAECGWLGKISKVSPTKGDTLLMDIRTLDVKELSMILCQIDTYLNSRPIAGFSNNPADLSYLTPAYLFIGTSLLAPPRLSVLHLKKSRMSRWQEIQNMNEREGGNTRSDQG